MKNKLLLLVTLAAPLAGMAAKNGIERYAADYYKLHAGEHLGKEVNVYVHYATICDPFEYYHPDYVMAEVDTSSGEKESGSILVSVPVDEITAFKKLYTKQGDYLEVLEQAEELKGTLLAGKTKDGRKFLYIAYGDRETDQQIRKYIGKKISIQAHSAVPDISESLGHIANTSSYLVQTENEGIKSGRITVAISNDNLPYFKKTFSRTDKSPQKLSGYLYEHQSAVGKIFFLYCDTKPLETTNQ